MAVNTITSFVATLLYRETMADNVRQIVAEFDEAFRNRPQLPYSFGRPYDDFAVFDIEGAHIVIAHGDTAAPDGARGPEDRAVVVLAISAAVASDPTLEPRFQRLLRSIVGRIQRPYPAEEVLWSECAGAFEPGMFDAVLAEATATPAHNLVKTAPSNAQAKAAAHANTAGPRGHDAMQSNPPYDADIGLPPEHPADSAPRPHHPKSGDQPASSVERPPNRFTPVGDVVGRIVNPPRASIRPAAIPRVVVANSLPDIPAPKLSDAARIRFALYPPAPAVQPPNQAPTVHRLSIYTLNTALILVAMPVGVALLTYNVLGRESFTTTARSMALAGFGVALAHTTSFGQALLALI